MENIAGFFGFVALVIIYLFPTVIAASKQRKNSTAIFLVNFFFGWSIIGWFIALIWAVTEDR